MPKKVPKQTPVKKASPKKPEEDAGFTPESLRVTLKSKTKAELLDMIVSFARCHESVREKFEREAEIKAAKKPDTPEKLLQRAKKLIEKGTKIDRDDPYFKKVGFGGPKLHLEPVCEVVRLLEEIKTRAAFEVVQEITKLLLERGKHYFDESWGAETAFDYEWTFEYIAGAICSFDVDRNELLRWAEKMLDLDFNCIIGDFYNIIDKSSQKINKRKSKS